MARGWHGRREPRWLASGRQRVPAQVMVEFRKLGKAERGHRSSSALQEASRTAAMCHAPPLATANWPPRRATNRRWWGDGSEALAMSTRAPEAPAKGTGLVLLTLAAGQFLMTLDSSVMNVSIATVAKDVGTTVTGIQTAITLY